MDQIDVKVFALITGGTLFVVNVFKKIFPSLTEDREELWAGILPVLFVVIAKLCHAFHGTDWVTALLWAVGSGVGSGIAHDYAAKPGLSAIKGILSSLFGSKPSASGGPTPPAGGDEKS